MFKKILFIAVISFVSFFTAAQGGTVRGFIKSQDDGNAVPFVKVYIKGAELGANTDFNGFYSIPKQSKAAETSIIPYPK